MLQGSFESGQQAPASLFEWNRLDAGVDVSHAPRDFFVPIRLRLCYIISVK
jgi:hypothetical protein